MCQTFLSLIITYKLVLSKLRDLLSTDKIHLCKLIKVTTHNLRKSRSQNTHIMFNLNRCHNNTC